MMRFFFQIPDLVRIRLVFYSPTVLMFLREIFHNSFQILDCFIFKALNASFFLASTIVIGRQVCDDLMLFLKAACLEIRLQNSLVLVCF